MAPGEALLREGDGKKKESCNMAQDTGDASHAGSISIKQAEVATNRRVAMAGTSSRIEAEDAVILFADLQQGIVELARTNPLEQLRKSVLALAKLAKLFVIPAFVSGIQGEDGSAAKMLPEIGEGLGDLPTHHRTMCDSMRSEEILGALENTGRKTLLISGVATELAVQLAALTAADLGYRVLVVLDACGGISERTEQAALLRMAKAGVTTISVMTLAGEIAGDFRQPKAQQAIGILYGMAQG
jgi:isochorismate hydrolase